MVARAVLLPAGADPFLDAYWLRHFESWSDEVDELRMQVCGADRQTKAYLRKIAGPKVRLTFTPRMDHGLAIGKLLDETSAEHVMLVEDDAFVSRKDAVAAAFGRIESGEADIVACPRTSMTPDVAEQARTRFGNLVSETDEQGPALWPCFYFGRRSDLLDTDRHFGSAAWKPGEEVPGLGYIARNESAADTFTGTSFQLRSRGLRIHVEAQYRANLSRMVDWRDIPWFHVGSLSSGFGYYFLTAMAEQDQQAHADAIRNDLHDWAKRMAWWQKVSETPDLPELGDRYREAIEGFRRRVGMKQDDVDTWRHLFDRMTAWT